MTGPLRLDGVFGVLPTAFHDDDALDLDGTAALVHAYVDAGVAGVTALGVMGEAAELTEEERRRVMAAAVAGAAPRPVIVGVSGETREIVGARARDAAGRGVSAVMVSPSRTLGLREAVDAAADGGLPVVVQDYPAGSGVVLDHDAIAAVADGCRLVVGVKAEAPPTTGLIAALHRSHPGLGLLGGLGGLFLIDELRAGATGVMTGLAVPDRLVSIVARYATDPAGAERAWTDLLPLMRLEAFQPFSLAARKEVWRLRGVIGSARCRRAGATLDERARDDVRRALDRVLA
ncbi:MAG TPA: dihydrodipicolinate synthase family protein [Candidatus Limnocylindrales bacterium]